MWPRAHWENTGLLKGEIRVWEAAAQAPLERPLMATGDDSPECLVKEPRLDPSAMGSTEGFSP